MSKKEVERLIGPCFYLSTWKQKAVLFVLGVFALGIPTAKLDHPHTHVEFDSTMITVSMPFGASGNSSAHGVAATFNFAIEWGSDTEGKG